MRGTAFVASMLFALASTESGARADDARDASRSAYRRGVQQAEHGNYVAARDSFLEAYKLFAHPSILLNLGIARLMTHEYVDAEQDLTRFLSDDGGAPPNEIASARSALGDARAHLGTFLLRVSPGGARARIDERAVALISGEFVPVRATVGAHALHVEADGFETIERSVAIEPTRSDRIDLELRRTGEVAAPATAVDRTRSTVGWICVGGAAAFTGFGVFAGLRSLSLAHAYNTPNSGSFQEASTRSGGTTLRTLADVAFGAAAVSAGIGIYLVLSSPAPRGVQANVVVAPSFTGVSGRF